VNQIIEYLENDKDDVCFSEYAQLHINRMIQRGQMRNSRNYKLAVQHLERFLGTNKIMFSQLTVFVLRKWFLNLDRTHRAKEMYPTCVRQIYKAALVELNDEELGIIRIKLNPWNKLKIPHGDQAQQLAISAEECREFFNRPLPQTKLIAPTPELGRDVALLILCLGGINTVDLFNMQKENYRNGVFCYNRAKTKNGRADQAYFEIRIEPFIRPIVEKYKSDEDDPYFFNFHKRYCGSDSFNANINTGIRKICQDMGLEKEKWYCGYTFRHTWGTIAQNDCDANLYEVAFGMNHTQGLNVTRGYVKLDFTPAWNLNAKVIDFVFYSNKASRQGKARDIEHSEDKLFRLSPKRMVNARAYFKGEILAEVTDIGFSNIDSVIDHLAAQLPPSIPAGCMLQFRIKDCDTGKEVVYERSKGKGF
jgi:integrase